MYTFKSKVHISFLMRKTLTAALGLCWADRAECCQRKSGSQDYSVWWCPQEATCTADKASGRGQTPVELQSVDNDNHNRASGILSQDVFVQLHLHSSSEVLPKYSSKVSLYYYHIVREHRGVLKFQIRACVIGTRKAKHLDVTTMFTYSPANTPLGQAECAYYLSYFINCKRT